MQTKKQNQLSNQKRRKMSINNHKETAKKIGTLRSPISNHINQEIGQNALDQIIIPPAMLKEYDFTIDSETGDLIIEKKKTESVINNGKEHSNQDK